MLFPLVSPAKGAPRAPAPADTLSGRPAGQHTANTWMADRSHSMPDAITLEDAQRMVAVAIAESRSRGVKTAVAVVDARGDLLMAVRLDGARPYYPDIAYGKAMGSA